MSQHASWACCKQAILILLDVQASAQTCTDAQQPVCSTAESPLRRALLLSLAVSTATLPLIGAEVMCVAGRLGPRITMLAHLHACTAAAQYMMPAFFRCRGVQLAIRHDGTGRQITVCSAAAGCGAARADIVYEAVRSSVRPETDSRTALVNLLDAKGTLLELKVRRLSCHRHHWCYVAPQSADRIWTTRPQESSRMLTRHERLSVTSGTWCTRSPCAPIWAGIGSDKARQRGTLQSPAPATWHGQTPA
jgi:hypothetical protein